MSPALASRDATAVLAVLELVATYLRERSPEELEAPLLAHVERAVQLLESVR